MNPRNGSQRPRGVGPAEDNVTSERTLPEDPRAWRIVLDYPMDVLLDRRCKLQDYENGIIEHLRNGKKLRSFTPSLTGSIGGLTFPNPGNAGSGNILLIGKPGTGKSTLALQWAVACTNEPNTYSSLFISLEETSAQVRQKAKDLGWDGRLRELRFCRIGEEFARGLPLEKQAQVLEHALRRPKRDCAMDAWREEDGKEPTCDAHLPELPEEDRRTLFLATLTPKARGCSDPQRTFDERYHQVEDLLIAFEQLRESDKESRKPKLRMVCIDGLGSFGDGPLSREQIRQLFGLFQRCGVVGICTAEEAGTGDIQEMEYLADIVVHLQGEEDGSYFVRDLEITKSRYQQQVSGRHPFRIRSPEPEQKKAEFQALIVCPSIHYISSATPYIEESTSGPRSPTAASTNGGNAGESRPATEHFDIGCPGIEGILPIELPCPAVVTIRGRSGTYKSSIAHNFLLRGFAKGEKAPAPQSALLLTLAEEVRFRGNGSKWVLHQKTSKAQCWQWEHDKQIKDLQIDNTKLQRRVWQDTKSGALLVELAFKQGALQAEEFIEYVRDAFRIPTQAAIRRVVLDDVSMIGTSYPLLRHSQTAGDLCLSTFVHLMRAKKANLVMVGSPGNFVEADEMVNRACTLSDTVLSCDFCDIFGRRHVLVTGEGLMSGRGAEGTSEGAAGEVVPGVIKIHHEAHDKPSSTTFTVDRKTLRGLVGYDKGDIHRPGILLNVFSEGALLDGYNDEIRTMLERACASPVPSEVAFSGEQDQRLLSRIVTVQKYRSDSSEAIHDSLTILGSNPVDKTVLVGVDEFVAADRERRQGKTKILDAFADLPLPDPPPGEKRWRYYVGNPDTTRGPDSPTNRLRPYYANVLVLAYNSRLVNADWTNKKLPTWSEILDVIKTARWEPPALPQVSSPKTEGDVWDAFIDEWFARPYLKRSRADEQRCSAYWPFEVGAWSPETLACILLDAIVSGSSSGPTLNEKDLYDPDKVAKTDKARGEKLLEFIKGLEGPKKEKLRLGLTKELTSLAYLFYYSWRHWELNLGRAQTQRIEGRLANKLVPNAAVYVCWYTQLRELIDEYPQLGSIMRVSPLPGSGSKGDWFMGVARGSVSLSLGKDVLDTLSAEDEDRKRFVRGVGLPVYNAYTKEGQEKDFLAWPRAKGREKGIYLKDVIDIHQRALSRSKIPDYVGLRGMLGTFGRQIAFSAEDESMSTEDAVKDCIDRLPKIVKLLQTTKGR